LLLKQRHGLAYHNKIANAKWQTGKNATGSYVDDKGQCAYLKIRKTAEREYAVVGINKREIAKGTLCTNLEGLTGLES
jgi:hypothetical protein